MPHRLGVLAVPKQTKVVSSVQSLLKNACGALCVVHSEFGAEEGGEEEAPRKGEILGLVLEAAIG